NKIILDMQKTSIIVASIAALGIVLAACFFGNAIKNRNITDDTISVVGLGTVDFVSDEIMWQGNFQFKSMDPKEAYSKILEDKAKVKSFFMQKGFAENEINFGGVNVTKTFRTIYVKNDNNYETR